jgi:hypothetical protein
VIWLGFELLGIDKGSEDGLKDGLEDGSWIGFKLGSIA